MGLIQVMKALSDETRIRILNILKGGGLCVCEIEALLGINQSNASRHLNKLLGANLVEYYKRAQFVYYRINQDTIEEFPFIREIIEKETLKVKQCIIDSERLKKYKDSGLGCDDLKEGRTCLDNLIQH